MAGVLDGGGCVKGFLVYVAGLQDVHHIAEVAAEALPGALRVVDGAGSVQDGDGFVTKEQFLALRMGPAGGGGGK